MGLFKKIIKKDELDIKNINESISLVKVILKIVTVLLVIVGVYIGIRILKELHVFDIMITIIKIISPLFIGFFIAWLFNPIVTKLEQKGIRRSIGTLLVYLVFIIILAIIIGSIVPVIGSQINDFVKMVPHVISNTKSWIVDILSGFDGVDVDSVKTTIFSRIEDIGNELTKSMPDRIISSARAFGRGAGNTLVGFIIGFFLLHNFENVSDTFVPLLPKRVQEPTRDILTEINTVFRRFINGALLDSTLVFIVSSISFAIAGLKAPLLFGLFCGLTNVIPYAGPYIGGIPAVIVGLSQSFKIGIVVLIAIILIQAIEGNLIQPLIMSKSAKLHPVTVIIGLLVFGYFFGIIGMAISTPIIGAIKAIIKLMNEKYHFLEVKE